MTLPQPNPHCRIGRITFHKVKSSRRLSEFNITTNRLIAGVKARGGK